MAQDADRIDGWKAIGAYFGRDRTTAIRWAKHRNLPVRHVPGGKTRTVYAYRHELAAWQASPTLPDDAPSAPEPAPAQPPAETTARRRPPAILLALAGAVALAGALRLHRPAPADRQAAIPADPAIASLYLEARDTWAQRNGAAVMRAIPMLETVVRRDPGFAPGYAALADADLLSSELGPVPDAVAFRRARVAAARALRLDPDLAAAHRASGFIAYWGDHDRAAAGDAFRAAIAADPDNAQTHFWYGNVLADNGEPVAALREFRAAQLADPGNVAISTDLAWALWSRGQEAAAVDRLKALIARSPDDQQAYDCLSVIALSRGDYAGYVRELDSRARLRGSVELQAHVDALKRALAIGDVPGMQRMILARALALAAAMAPPDRVWSAYLASLFGDRERLLAILASAEAGRESWGSAGYTMRIARRWRDDPVIVRLLARRTPPAIDRTT